jgi:hypothetical protein
LDPTAQSWHAPTLFANDRGVNQQNETLLLRKQLQAIPDADCLKVIRVGCKDTKQTEEAIVEAGILQELRDQSFQTRPLATRHDNQHIKIKVTPIAFQKKEMAIWSKAGESTIHHVGGAHFLGTTKKHIFSIF